MQCRVISPQFRMRYLARSTGTRFWRRASSFASMRSRTTFKLRSPYPSESASHLRGSNLRTTLVLPQARKHRVLSQCLRRSELLEAPVRDSRTGLGPCERRPQRVTRLWVRRRPPPQSARFAPDLVGHGMEIGCRGRVNGISLRSANPIENRPRTPSHLTPLAGEEPIRTTAEVDSETFRFRIAGPADTASREGILRQASGEANTWQTSIRSAMHWHISHHT